MNDFIEKNMKQYINHDKSYIELLFVTEKGCYLYNDDNNTFQYIKKYIKSTDIWCDIVENKDDKFYIQYMERELETSQWITDEGFITKKMYNVFDFEDVEFELVCEKTYFSKGVFEDDEEKNESSCEDSSENDNTSCDSDDEHLFNEDADNVITVWYIRTKTLYNNIKDDLRKVHKIFNPI